jgi:hypothetical protein
MKKIIFAAFIVMILFSCKKTVTPVPIPPVPVPITYTIGQDTLGGIVFWTDSARVKGLVASKVNFIPTGGKWWPQGGSTSIITIDTSMGGGQLNTNIIAETPGCLPESIIRQVYDVSIAGYTDWYCPNNNELTALYNQRNLSGLSGVTQGSRYWSSQALGSILAWFHCWCPVSIPMGADRKDQVGWVWPVRKIGKW